MREGPERWGEDLGVCYYDLSRVFSGVLKKAAESGGAGEEQKEGQKAQGAWHS